ncbi:TatD family hydrolase [Paenibacillus sp. F411]|uniref:TatD family hydrolase n=1 Tax=Paenibacillus sp. F411 TaxID=2820239 RepID=UPI001AAFE175|nr:TatD family hydrolase [Paenibacillus sp. F411]MBO2945868.1 TatD family hydrolase [Paenibacillus sp. F411]
MQSSYIDTHIHLDAYSAEAQGTILAELAGCGVTSLISVSMGLESARSNLLLSRQHASVKPAFGFHPEQPLPTAEEADELFLFMEHHLKDMAAVGEVGLPYYTRIEAEARGETWDNRPYEELLERFIAFAAKHGKPIVLHAVYEDADVAYALLKKHGMLAAAHFHWFKGSADTIERLARGGSYISFTPDLLYEEDIQELARRYPAEQVMTETDGPWPFEGPFAGRLTHPCMTAEVAAAWAEITGIEAQSAVELLYRNALRFYRLEEAAAGSEF